MQDIELKDLVVLMIMLILACINVWVIEYLMNNCN